MRTPRTQSHIRKSQRILNGGYISRFLEVDGGLIHIKRRLYDFNKKDVVYPRDDEDKDDCDDIDDTNDSDDDRAHKNGYRDEDWVRKSQRENSYYDLDNTPNFDVNSCSDELSYLLNDNDDGRPNIVTYVRRKRKSLESSLKKCGKQGDNPRSCRAQSRRKAPRLPSWIDKKRRAFRMRECKEEKLVTPGSCNEHICRKLLKAVEGSELAKSSASSQAHEESESLGTTLLQLQPSSPLVFLTTVLEGLPKELGDVEPSKSSHEAQSTCILSSLTTNDTERCLPQQTEKLDIEKEKNEGSMELTQKLKRKKHRPKVLCDKAKRMPKSTKKKLPEQEKDGLSKDQQTKLPRKRRAKREQGACKSAIKIKKRRGFKQGITLVGNNSIVLSDGNLSTISLCRSSEEDSIVPFQSNDLIGLPDRLKEKSSLRNLTVKEILYAQDLSIAPFCSREEPCKEDLSMCTYLAEGHVRFSPELTKYMQGYRMTFQSPQQQSAPSICANNWYVPLEFTKEATWSTSVFSLVQSNPAYSTELLLMQEPTNQLELVAYDQRREMITSKSTRLQSKFRAKVQLDVENERMWPLLALGGIPEKFDDFLYWERERALMERRVELFICTMQSVQGDRHFSPWKGSILDSIVGAFLTQNVSDHLSSSAFISVASRFPSKQGNDSERTHTFKANGTPNPETTCASNGVPRGMQSNTKDKKEKHSNMQENFILLNASNQEGTPLTCGMPVKCLKISNPCTSLRALKSVLRNNSTSHTEDIEFRRTSVTPIKTLGGESSAFKDESHLNRASPHLTKENLSVEQHDINIPSLCDHENVAASFTLQSGMQLEEGFSTHLREAKSLIEQNDVSFSRPNHLNTTTVSQTRQSDMQHAGVVFPCLMEEHDPMKLRDTSIPTVIDCTRVSMQHPDRLSLCSIEDLNSMICSDVNTFGSSYHESTIYRLDLYKTCASNKDKGAHCSSFGSEVSCNEKCLTSPSLTSELLAGNDSSNALQKGTTPTDDNHSAEQFTTEGRCGGRTEVYQNHAVCRRLFKDDILEKMNFKTTACLDYDTQQTPSSSHTAIHTDVHPLYAIQKSKEIHCESDVEHSTHLPSVSNIVQSRRYHSLSGIERAYLEENQNGRKKNVTQDWEALRKLTLQTCSSCENTSEENSKVDAHQDSVDWNAVRCASVEDLAATIKERGMHHVLSGRIKAFLKTLHEEQGNLDLEWLRKVSPENAKAYLMGIRGLGLKSVECIRLLTLHHVAFPVDVNVGRICVRLGWVPIEPLPEQLQLHLLELYPVQETIQKYLWPRLCMLDQKTLYELHYQLITFGKVFCTKSKPNCNACPLRTECKHFASAYSSAKLLLTRPNDEPPKRLCASTQVNVLTNSSIDTEEEVMVEDVSDKATSYPHISEIDCDSRDSCSTFHQYFIDEPASPEAIHESDIGDIEDFPCIYGSLNDFTEDLLKAEKFSDLPLKFIADTYIGQNKTCNMQTCTTDAGNDVTCQNNRGEQFNPREAILETLTELASCSGYNSDNPSNEKSLSYESKVCQVTFDVNEAAADAVVSLSEGAYIPSPKLKNVDRLRTVHYVYELPDTHPLLEQADVREKGDPSLYLLAIWSPDEVPSSLQGLDQADLCKSSFANPNEIVPGTLLIPCRTAMRGKFPLNGTYFQVNEVFADHASSLQPFQIPRSDIWSLQRRFVYFGTSVSNIFRGLTSNEIKGCFLRGHVCVRGFDREKRAPRPLVCRLHFPISKQIQRNRKHDQEAFSTG